MTRSVRVGSWVLAAAAAAALTSAVASGHVKFFKGKVQASASIQYTNQDPAPVPPGGGPGPTPADPIDFFSGVVSAVSRGPAGAACVSGRTVQVRTVGSAIVVGQTTTFSDGSWQISAEDVAADQYFAVVAHRKVTVTIPGVPGVVQGHKHKYFCAKEKSGSIAAGP